MDNWKDYLTEIEVAKIEFFNKDPEMVEAVKKVLLQHLYVQGVIAKGATHNPLHNRALALVANTNGDNSELGANLRALWEGVNALEAGFNDLGKIKSKIESPFQEENNAI